MTKKVKSIIDRAIQLSNKTGKIMPLLEPYEMDAINEALNSGKVLFFLGGIGEEVKTVSDPLRSFFYGHVFGWVAAIYERYTQEKLKVNKIEFGKNFLLGLYTVETQDIDFMGIRISVPIEPISFSRSGDMGVLFDAIDVWTKWFAENLDETFPQPDPLYRLKTTTVKVTKNDRLQDTAK